MVRSLALVLYGNNPRFPWKPSTTMLDNRLTGTRDARRLTATNTQVSRDHQPRRHPKTVRTRTRIFALHDAPKAPPLLDNNSCRYTRKIDGGPAVKF